MMRKLLNIYKTILYHSYKGVLQFPENHGNTFRIKQYKNDICNYCNGEGQNICSTCMSIEKECVDCNNAMEVENHIVYLIKTYFIYIKNYH
jgi:hypothetical protein